MTDSTFSPVRSDKQINFQISHSSTEYTFSKSIFQLLHWPAKFGTHCEDAVDDKFSKILFTLFFYSAVKFLSLAARNIVLAHK